MKFDLCWNCGKDAADILSGDGFVTCAKCSATGPSPDPEGLLWREMYLLSLRGYTPLPPAVAQAGRPASPSRLEIMMRVAERFAPISWDARPMAGFYVDHLAAIADGLIAAREKGGAT